ncbi:MAG: phosphoribosyltransferase [Porticoccaceae bacterium]|nr:phosphoribosyltransferase [Porticoccaceae bacterium]
MKLPLTNRAVAGRALADALAAYRDQKNILVLALPRGGVPVAYEVASALGAPLDLVLVRKLGAPGQRELAMGAIASDGTKVLNREIIKSLQITNEDIERVQREEEQELARREQIYRGDQVRPEIQGKTIILVDDGVATGATMRAAVSLLRTQNPGRIVIALPVAPAEIIALLRREADEVICLYCPEPFLAIGYWYQDFTQVSDHEVRDILARARQAS